ncbi:MAG: HK97 family phage prohead protease, partial [Bacilli bacterium]|nr:HK97 family phage prohead protease [Bacilli bacterium]
MQFRAEETEDKKMEIKGYAAVFNSPETYSYTEVISDKAFDDADMSDVVLRYNHNDSFMVLARTR